MLRTHALARATALAAALLAPPGAAAQDASAPPAAPADSLPLTLTEALARVAAQSQEVRLARAQVDLARAQVTSARAAALPHIDGSVNYTRTFESQFNTGGFALPDSLRFEPDTTAPLADRVRYLERNAPNAGLGGLGSLFGNLPFGRPNAWTAALTGTQPLYAGGRVGAALRIAGQYREAAELGLREQLADIELQVRNAYFRALLAQELERIAAAAVVQADTFLAQERLRRQAGTASDLDALRAEVSAENLRPALVEARNAASLATLDLKRLVDLPLDQPVRLTTPLTVPAAAELAAPQVDAPLLLARRAAVQVAERQVAIREQQVRIARSGYLPSVDLTVNYARTAFPPGVFELSGQEWRTDFTALVGLRVPIFSGFRTGADVQEARINLLSERLRLAQLRENVELQYQQALGEKQRAAADITARQRTVDQAQRVYDLTVLRYEQGLATQLEVSDARLGALQARTNLAQAVSAFYLAEAGVARSLGTPMAAPAQGPPSAVPGTPPAAPTPAPAATTAPRTPATPPTPPAPRAP